MYYDKTEIRVTDLQGFGVLHSVSGFLKHFTVRTRSRVSEPKLPEILNPRPGVSEPKVPAFRYKIFRRILNTTSDRSLSRKPLVMEPGNFAPSDTYSIRDHLSTQTSKDRTQEGVGERSPLNLVLTTEERGKGHMDRVVR